MGGTQFVPYSACEAVKRRLFLSQAPPQTHLSPQDEDIIMSNSSQSQSLQQQQQNFIEQQRTGGDQEEAICKAFEWMLVDPESHGHLNK